MPRVLHLVHSLNRGGIEIWLMSILRFNRGLNDWQMDILCKGETVGEMASEAKSLGTQVYHCPLHPTHVDYYRCLKRLLEEGNYDLIHSHLEGYSGFPVWIARKLGVPIISSYHNPHFDPQTAYARRPGISFLRSVYVKYSINYALKHSTIVTGCSRAVLDELCGKGRPCKPETEVLHYGIELPSEDTLKSAESIRATQNWAEDTPLVLHVGRFHMQKNHKAVVEIFREVVKKVPDAKLILVGDGPLRRETLSQVAKSSISESVVWLGVREEVSSLMSQSDVFLFPSLYEGLPVVSIEANSVGLPVVGSNIPSLRESVVNGETALLHDLDDLDGMVDSVVRILVDKAFADRLRSSGPVWVKSRYTVGATMDRMMKLYDKCIAIAGSNNE